MRAWTVPHIESRVQSGTVFRGAFMSLTRWGPCLARHMGFVAVEEGSVQRLIGSCDRETNAFRHDGETTASWIKKYMEVQMKRVSDDYTCPLRLDNAHARLPISHPTFRFLAL